MSLWETKGFQDYAFFLLLQDVIPKGEIISMEADLSSEGSMEKMLCMLLIEVARKNKLYKHHKPAKRRKTSAERQKGNRLDYVNVYTFESSNFIDYKEIMLVRFQVAMEGTASPCKAIVMYSLYGTARRIALAQTCTRC